MSALLRVAPAPAPLRGVVRVPGDKSISHRALLFAALANGSSRARGLLQGADVRATRAAVEAMGVEVADDGDAVIVRGTGALAEPRDVIDCGNAGTAMRLLLGVLAGEPGFAVLTGDASLRRRPMGRVAVPLRSMGARIDGAGSGTRAPIAVRGGSLSPFPHTLDVASAQVKTALLLATRREGACVTEPGESRDHTERMLGAMGATVHRVGGTVTLDPVHTLDPLDVVVPGDLSSAAFWLVAASVVSDSVLTLPGVGCNPTRAGVLDVLRAMGASIEAHDAHEVGGEPVADLHVRAASLRGVRIDGALALRAIDELPVLAVAAACAHGETVIADAAELRVKESDRIARTVAGLRAFGVAVEERPDGMVIDGRGGLPAHAAAYVDATGDHRIAMAFAVASLASRGGGVVQGAEEIGTSYPSFLDDLRALAGDAGVAWG